MNMALACALVNALPASSPGLYNPYTDSCVHDMPGNGPQDRLTRLAQHLDCDARLLLCGEAPGYQGARYTGCAFTSERLILDGMVPRVPPPGGRLTSRRLPFSEPSATIVWGALYDLQVAETTVMWNALQLHPYRQPAIWSNRPPNPDELRVGREALNILIAHFSTACIVAVGQKAALTLREMGITPAATVRHPANGGATEFRQGLRALLG